MDKHGALIHPRRVVERPDGGVLCRSVQIDPRLRLCAIVRLLAKYASCRLQLVAYHRGIYLPENVSRKERG